MQNTSLLELSKIDILRGYNRHFFYVQKDIATQTDQLVELTFIQDNAKFYPLKKVVFNNTSGRLKAV